MKVWSSIQLNKCFIQQYDETIISLSVRSWVLFLYLHSLPTKGFWKWLGKSASDNIHSSHPTTII